MKELAKKYERLIEEELVPVTSCGEVIEFCDELIGWLNATKFMATEEKEDEQN